MPIRMKLRNQHNVHCPQRRPGCGRGSRASGPAGAPFMLARGLPLMTTTRQDSSLAESGARPTSRPSLVHLLEYNLNYLLRQQQLIISKMAELRTKVQSKVQQHLTPEQEEKLKQKFDARNFDPNAILRGAQLTVVGGSSP